jgi:hypothetical protein
MTLLAADGAPCGVEDAGGASTDERGVAALTGHGRYAIFQMAEVAVPRALFGRILERIARLRPPDPAPC